VLSVLSEAGGPFTAAGGTEPTSIIGAGVGSVGGTAVGLATCTPFLGAPPLYVLCALTGAARGAVAGVVAGSTDPAVLERAQREFASLLAELPAQRNLAARLRAEVLARLRAATPLQLVDMGEVADSRALERTLAPGMHNSTLSLRIVEIGVIPLSAERYQLVLTVQSELGGRRAGDLARKHAYRHFGEAFSRDAPRAALLAAASRSIEASIREAARATVEAQLGVRAGG
jgi:hypothetical protein